MWHEERAGSFRNADWDSGTWIELDDHMVEKNDVIVLTLLGRNGTCVQAVEGARLYLSEPVRLLCRIRIHRKTL